MQAKLRYLVTCTLILQILVPGVISEAQDGPLRIGLLVPDTVNKEIVHACELAIESASEKGIFQGSPPELVVRSADGPWGTGSKASVDLIYEDSVVALLCALDGRNAHLAEQVAAKTQVACIETHATDPSLTQAYVPWYLRCIPSDDQQARAILEKIDHLGSGKTAIICTGEYDTRMTAHSFIKIQASSGSPAPVIMNISDGKATARDLASQLNEKDIQYLVLSINTPLTMELLHLLRTEMPGLTIFGTFAFTAALKYEDKIFQEFEGLYLLTGAYPLSDRGRKFKAAFQEKYGYGPTVAAAYAYDGMQMILTALGTSGPDREKIRQALEKMDFRDGLTGRITFDDLGNRKNAAELIKIDK